jgi:hypothetical protein
MHKSQLAGLILGGMLVIGLAGATQAMKPASNADLRGCLGLYVGNSCTQVGTCNPATGTTPCGPSNYNGACVSDYNGMETDNTCGSPAVVNGCTGLRAYNYCSYVYFGNCHFSQTAGYTCIIQPGAVRMGTGQYSVCWYGS